MNTACPGPSHHGRSRPRPWVCWVEDAKQEKTRLPDGLGERHRWHAVRGHLHELAGDLSAAGAAYVEAARRAKSVAERDHLVRLAARARR